MNLLPVVLQSSLLSNGMFGEFHFLYFCQVKSSVLRSQTAPLPAPLVTLGTGDLLGLESAEVAESLTNFALQDICT